MDLLTYLENRQNMYAQEVQRLYEFQMSAQHQLFVTNENYVDMYEPLRRLAMAQFPKRTSEKRLTSFRISDILSQPGDDASGKRDSETSDKSDSRQHVPNPTPSEPRVPTRENTHADTRRHDRQQKRNSRHRDIARPWNTSHKHNNNYVRPVNIVGRGLPSSELDSDQEIDVEACDDEDEGARDVYSPHSDTVVSPLDALVQMSKTAFRGLDNIESQRRLDSSLVNKSQMAKKKRKTRTAFTNQQIYELEKRFLYQKYLTPADRDDIAQSLGLTCAQVITWFQNRRAKFKRDIEEMKNDVGASNPGTPVAVDDTDETDMHS